MQGKAYLRRWWNLLQKGHAAHQIVARYLTDFAIGGFVFWKGRDGSCWRRQRSGRAGQGRHASAASCDGALMLCQQALDDLPLVIQGLEQISFLEDLGLDEALQLGYVAVQRVNLAAMLF